MSLQGLTLFEQFRVVIFQLLALVDEEGLPLNFSQFEEISKERLIRSQEHVELWNEQSLAILG